MPELEANVVSDREAQHTALDALFAEATGEKPPASEPGAAGSSAPAAAESAKGVPAGGVPASPVAGAGAAAGASSAASIDIKPKPSPGPGSSTLTGVPAGSPAGLTPVPSSSPAAPAAPAAAAAKDQLDSVELPPYSKPKSVEAFSKVKELARQTITQRDEEITRLRAEVAQREEKLKGVLPPEAAKELEDLRTFRRSVDIEHDPEFKKVFDGKIEQNNLTIMSKLVDAGLTKVQLEEIRRLGGPEAVDWDEILPRLPAQTRRFIEAKLVQNEDIRGERKTAMEQAKKDPGIFEKQKIEHQSKTIYDTANQFLAGLPWTAEHPIPATAKPEEKVKLEADNAFAKETQERITKTLTEFSPARFAELAVGTAMAYKFKRDAELAAKDLEASKSTIDIITKERDALKSELEKIKQSGQTHRRTSATPPQPAPHRFEHGAIALDRLRDEITMP